MGCEPFSRALSDGARSDAPARRSGRRRARAGTGVALGASAALHLRHQRQAGRIDRRALSGARQRPWRAVHLSWPRPARSLSGARPEKPRRRRAPLRVGAGGMDHPHARRSRRTRRAERVGVWVRRPDEHDAGEDKIAAIGIRVRRWVTLHGVSLNVAPDLSHFSGIVPCGVSDSRYGVTSLADLGLHVSMAEVDAALRREFELVFGSVIAEGGDEGNRSLLL